MFGIRTKFRRSTISIVLTVSVTKRIFPSYKFFLTFKIVGDSCTILLVENSAYSIVLPKFYVFNDGDFKLNVIVFDKC